MIERIVVGALQTNCYIIYEGFTAAIIDPGDEAEKILERLETLNLNPAAIFLTHGHFDHIGAAEEIREKTGAKIYCSKDEKEILGSFRLNLSEYGNNLLAFSPDEVFSDGDEILVGDLRFKFMRTPGHTKGSFVIFSEDNLFSGDTLFSDGYGRTDFPTGNGEELWNSLRKLRSLDSDYNVFPGHGEPFYLKKRG
jgi:glyoxylase-like metal-dependent hydrolase (beta-lactamase superfamily II)